jgi:hypothetical protein
MKWIALGHRSQPGNSNAQKSVPESASAGVVVNRHRALTGECRADWISGNMMRFRIRREL